MELLNRKKMKQYNKEFEFISKESQVDSLELQSKYLTSFVFNLGVNS